jgi:hypothetical protein
MKDVVIKLHGVEMQNFDCRTCTAKMVIFYDIDDNSIKKVVNFDLNKKSEIIVNSILNFLKSQANVDVDGDDIVSNIFVKKFVNEENVEEKLIVYFSKLRENVKFMKINNNHADYMKLYDQIKTSKISFN